MQYISFMDNSKKALKIKRTSLSQEVYQHLQQQIITLELAPGEKLNDLELAEQFGVSRTPVREALKKLEEEGLVVFKPGSRTNVTALDVVQARETFPIVATLHGLASRLAFPHIIAGDVSDVTGAKYRISDGNRSGGCPRGDAM